MEFFLRNEADPEMNDYTLTTKNFLSSFGDTRKASSADTRVVEIQRVMTLNVLCRRWQKASKVFSASHLLCEECLKHGRYTKATIVDHIVPHRGYPKLFWDRSN